MSILKGYICDPQCPLEPPEPLNSSSDSRRDSKVTLCFPVDSGSSDSKKVTRKATFGSKRSQYSKDGSRLPPPPQSSTELWGSAGLKGSVEGFTP